MDLKIFRKCFKFFSEIERFSL